MTRNYLALISLVLFSTATYGQLSAGIKAGGAATRTGGEFKGDRKAAFYAGGTAAYTLSSVISLHADLYYAQQNSKGTQTLIYGGGWTPDGGYDPNAPAGISTGNLHMQYINLPVLARYTHTSGLFAEAGLQAGYLLSARIKFPNTSYDTKNSYDKIDYAWLAGAGYHFSEGWGIQLRYNRSLRSSYRGEAIQAGLYYYFLK